MAAGPTLVVLGIALFLAAGWYHLRLARALRYGPIVPALASYPSVTVIRPVRGLDTGAAENIRAALDHGYPGDVETIFVFDREDEPALPIARREIAARHLAPEAARVRVVGDPPAHRTGKLNAMIVALKEARGEIIVFADSDIRPDHDALRVLVETLLAAPGTGTAFAPVMVRPRPKTAGDAGYAVLLNGYYGPAAAETARRNGGCMPFIMGQFMAWRRETIAAIGGLECADGQLVDDMYLGMRVVEAGLCNRMSSHAVPIIQRGLPFPAFIPVYRRWMTFSRTGLPGRQFKLDSYVRGLIFWFGFVLAAVAAWTGHPAGIVAGGAAAVASVASLIVLHGRFGGIPLPARHYWVPFALLLVGPLLLLTVILHPRVNWRGRSYRLDARSRLARR